MKQSVKQAIDSIKNFLSDRKNWVKIAALAVLIWAAIEAIISRHNNKRNEKEVSNEINS